MFQPFGERVTVRRHQHSSATDRSGLVIPDNGKEKPDEGTVLAVGPACTSGAVLGDHVFFGKFAGNEIKIGEEKIVVMHEAELLGRLARVCRNADDPSAMEVPLA